MRWTGRRARRALGRRRLVCSSRRSGTPLSDLARAGRRADRRGDEHAGGVASIVAVALGLAGIGVAWLIYGAKRVRGAARRVRSLEQKFYWDELYDWLWYRPADLSRAALARSSSGR